MPFFIWQMSNNASMLQPGGRPELLALSLMATAALYIVQIIILAGLIAWMVYKLIEERRDS